MVIHKNYRTEYDFAYYGVTFTVIARNEAIQTPNLEG